MDKIKLIKFIQIIAFCIGVIFYFSNNVKASEDWDDNNLFPDEIQMIKGDLVTIDGENITQVSISNPDVADIADADEDHVMVSALEAGQTVLFVWDDTGKRTFMIYVYKQNLDLVKERLRRLLKAAEIDGVSLKVNEQEGKVVVTGELTKEDKKEYDKIVERFSENIIDLVKERKKKDLIEVDVEFTQLDTTLAKELGFEWPETSIKYTESMPIFDGSVGDFFKIGDFSRTTQLLSVVHALLQKGRAKMLSSPHIVVKDGEQASFLVGGEVPIVTTTYHENTGTSTENVTYRSYGVSLTIQPQIVDNKIDMVLSVEISDIAGDYKAGDDVAFTTQTADTKLYLDDNQTIVLAGLIKNYESAIVKKVPFLGNVPVLGALFRYKGQTAPNKSSEIVISLTPRILTKRHKNNIKESNKKIINRNDFAGKKSFNYYKGIPKEMISYVNKVQEQIAQSIVYPQKALENGWEGEVDLNMHILNDGTLAFVLVDKSSGRDIFDENAVRTAKAIAPFDKFPSNTDLQEIDITVPIVYKLKTY